MESEREKIGIILVDHGSKHSEANDMLVEVVQLTRERLGGIVEPAHMELAEPTVAQAFAACVRQGAGHVVVHPYFLAPGRHSTVDIPRLASEAAALFAGISFAVTEPLGIDSRIIDVVAQRIAQVHEPETSRR
ncbi:MAG: cobalamin biosynthesis protein CbiX [Candidatus Hydrogenedentes bacterium]|nr:cobalamin biosynthesis protein CbiX [Candidatus Hydrogenedentota bacterium]